MQYKRVSKQSYAGNFKTTFCGMRTDFLLFIQKARLIFQTAKSFLFFAVQTSRTKKVMPLSFIENMSFLSLKYLGIQSC